ncbi:hypothetical protein JG688_00011461 [Phytophthora aleatoria]|uniref:Uncharacterized protein n=1 Tax=Phytophthora aleatoria TaxID=2496075 RepID=A0A8J5IP49_9STRA|nr:hypothetical protein JG688_00011461 [Phytophthora aleatoria]
METPCLSECRGWNCKQAGRGREESSFFPLLDAAGRRQHSDHAPLIFAGGFKCAVPHRKALRVFRERRGEDTAALTAAPAIVDRTGPPHLHSSPGSALPLIWLAEGPPSAVHKRPMPSVDSLRAEHQAIFEALGMSDRILAYCVIRAR